jgi:hypothetical protein
MDLVSRVEARIRTIQSLIGEHNGTKGVETAPGSRLQALGSDPRQGQGDGITASRCPGSELRAQCPVPSAGSEATRDFTSLIAEAAQRTGLSADLIGAVIRAESGFQASAVSPAGAMGLMQLMPGTARGLGVTDPFDPRQNVMAGSEYLRRQLMRFGTLEKALAAYNAGPGAVERHGGVPPYRETQEYVRRIVNTLGANASHAMRSVANASHAMRSVANASHAMRSVANASHAMRSVANASHAMRSVANSALSGAGLAPAAPEAILDESR